MLPAARSRVVAGAACRLPQARGFKSLKAERAKAQAQEAAATKASQGKDPYALFKEALDSEPGAPPEVDRKEWREWRATYSRAKMVEVCSARRVSLHSPAARFALASLAPLQRSFAVPGTRVFCVPCPFLEPTVRARAGAQHHRVNAHFTKMIQLREEAIKLLPPQLQEEARRVDTAPLPIERRIFTETAPIPGFQDKLASTAQEEL